MVGELQSTAILPGSFSAFTGTPGGKTLANFVGEIHINYI